MHQNAKTLVLPYGSWPSPLSAASVTTAGLRWGQVSVWGSSVYWEEGRPAEQGRVVLQFASATTVARPVTPSTYSVRTRAHEYGGGAHLVWDDTVYFCNFFDQKLYRCALGESPCPMGDYGRVYFADMQMDAPRGRLLAVREDHTTTDQDAPASLVAISLTAPFAATTLHEGHDFYASVTLSPDASRVAWLTWEHPHMPWDGSDLWSAPVNADGTLGESIHVAGGPHESIAQPRYSPDGDLWFVSDRTGWWNLYRLHGASIEAMCPMAAEFTRPQWVFGMSTYGFADVDTVWCSYQQDGISHLACLEIESHVLRVLAAPYQEINQLHVGEGFLAFEGGAPGRAKAIVRMDLETRSFSVLSDNSPTPIAPEWISTPRPIVYASTDGAIAHAFYYAPHNPDCTGPSGSAPPLLVMSHGGPTSACANTLNGSIQFWTSRGFAVVDVNYGGSTGYGRDYRNRLQGSFGIVDVDDCICAARYLVSEGLADGERLAIRGGSAGGFTTLSALTFHNAFKAGASYFGIGDLEGLARDTHKFESRYLDGLVGPYPADKAVYDARSPVRHAQLLNAALILFQGLEDKVVPPSQSEAMYGAAKANGLTVAYITYANEGHGFRSAHAQRHSLESELFFYSKIFGFCAADTLEPVVIENLPAPN